MDTRSPDARPPRSRPLPGRRTWTRRIWPLFGAVVGFAVGAGIYLIVAPAIEEGPLRDLQGFVWNAVPLLTVAGGVVGLLVGRR